MRKEWVRKGLSERREAFSLERCLMVSASGWSPRIWSKDKETPGMQERRLSAKDIRFLYMVLWVMGGYPMPGRSYYLNVGYRF